MKDNLNAGKDLKIICNRPELEMDERRPNVMPKVVYTLMKDQKRRISDWIRVLKFSYRYASNMAHCVDMKELRMHGMKKMTKIALMRIMRLTRPMAEWNASLTSLASAHGRWSRYSTLIGWLSSDDRAAIVAGSGWEQEQGPWL
ncbi:UNVERIFIED_CONTAM: hypothetical protein Slati_4465200 [Sesamum latifolium]|uniref:Reverse transcriptase n=1 Tax=Sesamum latifolium TaxID=2727402 RepID=A0AAW2SR83_9LAMI